MLVVKSVEFDAAHFLPNYEGKCKRLHGHRWKVEIGVEGIVGKHTGIVVDFAELKKDLGTILKKFDHHLLNDTVKNPTAENLASYISSLLQTTPTSFTRAGCNHQLRFVRVWESPDSYAEVGS